MASFNANVFFFMFACGKKVSASEPNLLRWGSLNDDDAAFERERRAKALSYRGLGFGFVPLDYSSTYGSTTSLDALSPHKTDRSLHVMITSQCVSPIPKTKSHRKPKRYKKPRCYKCNRPGHFAFYCRTRI